MKQSSFLWVVGCVLLPFSNVQATPTSIHSYPHYFDGTRPPPQQITPQSIGYNCEVTAENFAKSFAGETFGIDYSQPSVRTDHKQLSWSFLHRRDSNRSVLREIYLFTFTQVHQKPLNLLILIDSTKGKGGCPLHVDVYPVSNDLNTDNSTFGALEKDDGSRQLVKYPSSTKTPSQKKDKITQTTKK